MKMFAHRLMHAMWAELVPALRRAPVGACPLCAFYERGIERGYLGTIPAHVCTELVPAKAPQPPAVSFVHRSIGQRRRWAKAEARRLAV